MTYPERIAERITKQASSIRMEPSRLLLQELLDIQRAYVVALEIMLKESKNDNRTGGGVSE